jgi:hypothetical protein
MKKIFLLIITLIISINLSAQNYTQTIRGVIVDKTTQTPLPGASIVILNTSTLIGTATNLDGEFRFDSIPVGRHSLQISFIGYKTINISNVLLTSGKQLVLNIEMEEQASYLKEIVIIADKQKGNVINEMASISARTFSVEETERYAGSLGDPARMVSNFAGVTMVNDQRNDIIIRGNSPVGLLWRLDGIEIPNPNHFGASGTTGGPVSMLNNNLLSNSDFFTSAFPAEYGNAMSGVFDLTMRSGNNQKREYVAQVGFNGFEIGAEGPLIKGEKSSYLINYRYSTLGLLNAIGFDFGTGTAIPQYQDLTFKIDLLKTKLGKFTIFGLGGKSYIQLHDSKIEANDDANYNLSGTDLDYGTNTGVLALSNLYFFNEKTRIKTILSIQGAQGTTKLDSLKFDNTGKIIENSNYRYYGSNNTEIKYSFSTHFIKKIDSKNNYKIGIYYDLYNIEAIDSVLISSGDFHNNYNIKNKNISIIRAYSAWQHKFSNFFTTNYGIYSQFYNKEVSIEPRFGLSYQLTEKQKLSAGYGLHSQMQPRMYYFSQTYLSDNLYLQNNQNMKFSKSHQIVLGYEYFINSNTRIKLETYYQYLFNIPVSNTFPEFSMINTGTEFYESIPDSLENKGTGENYGLEITIEKFLSNNFYFLSTMSLYDSKYKGYDDKTRNTAFNNNFVCNILGGYEFYINQNLSLSFDVKSSYALGKPYVPIDIDASILQNETVYDWNKAFEKKYDNYFRTDIRISFKLNGKKINQEWAIDLQNITNHQNIYSEAYNPRTKNFIRTYQTGFYPMLLYRIRF